MTGDAWDADRRRVLLLPPTRRDAEALRTVLSGAGIVCAVCATLAELAGEVAHGAGAVVVSEEALHAGPDGLAAVLRAQPVWSDLPVIVLSRAGVESPALAREMGSLGNVSVLERPVRMTTFLSVVGSALRARQRQYEMRDHLAERDRVAAELRHSREQVEVVVKGANVGVWFCPLPFDRLIWDETVKAHFHLPPDAEVTIDTFYERLHPEDRERTRATIAESIARREAYDIDYRTVSPDGRSTKWVRASGRGFYDAEGNPTRFDGITIDVTDRRRIEQERERLIDSERAARAEAERASRMKDEFLATLSHELRTPLNAIFGWAQVLGTGEPTPEDVREGVEVIERNARAQTRIIEDLLDMSRIVSGTIRLNVQPVDLSAVVRSALETVRPAADAKGVHLDVHHDPLATPVTGDAHRLQQVFWNLLTNAVKFTGRDGVVRVVSRRQESHVEVSVTDTGEGIRPEFLPFVFDRFRQADASTTRRHGGLGLGLAIVKQLVETHGGHVRAESRGAGLGATFTVALPVTAVRPAGATAAEPGPAATPRSAGGSAAADATRVTLRLDGLRLLVVDDEPDARDLLRRLLDGCGARVTTAGSAAEALERVRTDRPDVLVSDIGMPEADGYALIAGVRALGPGAGGDTPAVALTAYARAEDRARALRAGFGGHVVKPVEPAELVALVARLATPPRTATAK